MIKTLIRIGINTAIGALLIFFWFRLVDVEEIIHALESFNPFILIPALAFAASASVIKALRFKILLSRVVSIPSLKIINLTFLSQLLSFTIPIRLGEIAKGVYLSTDYGLHFGKAVVWVFLDRFLDFWAVLGLSLLLLSVVPTNLSPQFNGFLFAGAGGLTLIIVLVVVKPEMFRFLAKSFSKLLIFKKLKEKFLDFSYFIIDCFSLLKGGAKRGLTLTVLTVLATLMEGLSWYIILGAFIPDLPVLKAWLGSMLNSLTFLIPAAPGYVGSAEAAGLAVFSFGLGLNATYVSAATIIIHALSLVFILTSGIIGLYALKFNLGLVWRKVLRKE